MAPDAGKRARTYVLRMRKFSDYHNKVPSVYSDDWYVGELGFRSYYSITGNSVNIGINMCSFPADGVNGNRTMVRCKISIMDPCNKLQDWMLLEKTLYTYEDWARGIEVTVPFRELTRREHVKMMDTFMIRYDIENQA